LNWSLTKATTRKPIKSIESQAADRGKTFVRNTVCSKKLYEILFVRNNFVINPFLEEKNLTMFCHRFVEMFFSGLQFSDLIVRKSTIITFRKNFEDKILKFLRQRFETFVLIPVFRQQFISPK
jgi:hypothetical protein